LGLQEETLINMKVKQNNLIGNSSNQCSAHVHSEDCR